MPQGIRPTQGILRKAIFDILGQDMRGVIFLDLFAGSGAVGLEAFSRGATAVTFVEKDPRVAEILEENYRILSLSEVARQAHHTSNHTEQSLSVKGSPERHQEAMFLSRAKGQLSEGVGEIIPVDAFAAIKLLARKGKKFHIIFIDPPYGRGLAKKALKTLGGYDILQPNCMVAIEHEPREILPEKSGRFLLFRHKKYGSTCLSIYQASQKNDEPIGDLPRQF